MNVQWTDSEIPLPLKPSGWELRLPPPKNLPTPNGEDVAPAITGQVNPTIIEPINCRCEISPGNFNSKSLDEWDNPLQPVEDKSEGDAMMEFFKGK